MDDIVKQAMAKWPNVPDCYGWLGLDARGRWYLRDMETQALGSFPSSKGSLVEHEKLLAFIARNYEVDARGCWFFQNGPQRVYVELEAAPWVWHTNAQGDWIGHTGCRFQPTHCWIDEQGLVYLSDERLFGLVQSQDVQCVAQSLARGAWPVAETTRQELCKQFHVVLSPQVWLASAG